MKNTKKVVKWYYFYSWWIFVFFIAYKLGLHNYSPFITYIMIYVTLPVLKQRIKTQTIYNYKIFLWQLLTLIILDVIPIFFVEIDLSFKTILVNLLFFILHLLFIQPKSYIEFRNIYKYNDVYTQKSLNFNDFLYKRYV